jgi:hypothetical protein
MMQEIHIELNPGLPWQHQHSTRRKFVFTGGLCLNLRKKLVKYIWSIAFYCAEN